MKYSAAYFQDIKKHYPEVATGFDQLAKGISEAGPLDRKTQLLIKLGIAIGTGSEGDTQNLTMQALKAGISAEEIKQAVLLSITTAGFPKMIVAMQWVGDIIASQGKTAKPAYA